MTYKIISLHHNAIDRTGQRFGRLVAISPTGSTKAGLKWLCKCDCGKEAVVSACHLQSGHTTSCGCFNDECKSNRGIHWMRHTPEYETWQKLRKRCENKKDKNYKDYGGRGISVCDEWKSFTTFFSDMGKRPTSKHSIERIDNNGNYAVGNCKWATQVEQGRNKRNNRMISHNGETKCLSEWAEKYGIRPHTLRTRIVTLGWSFEEAIIAPVRCSK